MWWIFFGTLLLLSVLGMQIAILVTQINGNNETNEKVGTAINNLKSSVSDQQTHLKQSHYTLRSDIAAHTTNITENILYQLRQNGVLQSYSEHLGIDQEVVTHTKIGNPETRDAWIALKASQTPPG